MISAKKKTTDERKLSKSACEKWMACPASYDYHYNKRIRPIKTGSALVFGIGIDCALNELLQPTSMTPMSAYRDAVAKFPLGKIDYLKGDFDYELLSDLHKKELLERVRAVGYGGDDIDGLTCALITLRDVNEALSENQKKALDLIYRAILEVKAEIMIEAYRTQVLPHIGKVHSVQAYAGPGVMDLVADWKGRGKVIVDNKTSSRPYPNNAIDHSVQLAMYADETGILDVVYVVLIKQLKKHRIKTCSICGNVSTGRHKTCDALVDTHIQGDGKFERCNGEWTETISPECEVQIVHGTIIPEAIAVANELQREVKRAVDAGIFMCNVAQCNSQFGKPCVYRDLKWKGDMTGLEVLPLKESK